MATHTEQQQRPQQHRHRDVFRSCVEDLDRRGLRRRPRIVGGDDGKEANLKIDFTSNDYLGLSTHPLVRRAIARAALECGTWRSSPVVGGYSVYHRELELALMALKKTEECMLFSSGFAANVGVMTSLARLGYDFFSDELNHASLIDGMRMGNNNNASRRHVYRHNDLGHLEELLGAGCPDAKKAVVTDRLFSMDGDFCDLEGLLRLQRRFGFLLVVDEAHSTLVVDETNERSEVGESGGCSSPSLAGWPNEDVIRIGTLSKAVRFDVFDWRAGDGGGERAPPPRRRRRRGGHGDGSLASFPLQERRKQEFNGIMIIIIIIMIIIIIRSPTRDHHCPQVGQTGGFVCCSRIVRDVLFNLARTFVYSTALSVPTVVGARVAIELGTGREGDRRRAWLWRAVRACGGTSPILLLPARDEAALEAVRARMEAEGARVGAIRPPTVTGCRVRMSVCYVEGVGAAEVARWRGRCAALLGESGCVQGSRL